MKAPFRFHLIWVIAGSILLFALILLGFGCCKNPADNDEPDTVTDIDGNEYAIVKIGDQWWMAENLKVTHYRNGDAIPNVTDNAAWVALSTGACCVYENTAGNSATYGLLYNFYAVADARNIAPEGWHVPTDAEWTALGEYLGGEDVAGGKLKEAGTTHWASPNTGANDESGFTGLPGGFRYWTGVFDDMGYFGIFWSSTEMSMSTAIFRSLIYDSSELYGELYDKRGGFSIRCVKN